MPSVVLHLSEKKPTGRILRFYASGDPKEEHLICVGTSPR